MLLREFWLVLFELLFDVDVPLLPPSSPPALLAICAIAGAERPSAITPIRIVLRILSLQLFLSALSIWPGRE
jgi:hypothetical protein